MSKLVSHVALVSSDHDFRDHWLDALNECASHDEAGACCDFLFLAVDTADEALELALEDGLLQAVIIDAVLIDAAENKWAEENAAAQVETTQT